MNFFFKFFFFSFFFFSPKVGFSETSLKILIPNEKYKNDDQKQSDILNFQQSGVTAKEWRKRKCYNNVTFNIFWKSGLCPTDRNSCRNSLTVEELQTFKNYYNYLLQISELCADGYVLKESDGDFFKKSTQGEVDRFIKHIENTRKKQIDYSRPIKKKSVNKNKSINTLSVTRAKKTNDFSESNNKALENKKEVELLKKQVADLKKAEKKKQQEIEKLKESEKKRREELAVARKTEKKRLKEIEEAKKIEKKKERELMLQKRLLAEQEKKIEQQKKLLETEKKIDEIKKMIESNSSTNKSQNLNMEINKKKTESFETPAPAPKAKTKPNSSNSSGSLGNPFSSGLSFVPGGVGGMLGGGGLNIDALLGQQSQVVKTMTKALLNLTEAQAKFLEALGEKEAAIAARMYVDALKKGEAIGKDDLEKALTRTEESQAIIEKKILEVKVLDAKAKIIFAKGLPPYGRGVAGLVSTGFQAQQIVSSIGSNPNPLIITKIGSLFFIAKNTPSAISLFSNSTGTMMDFANKNEIDTKPLEEAKDAMGD